MKLGTMPLKYKLPVIVVAFSLLVSSSMLIGTYINIRQDTFATASDNMVESIHQRHKLLEEWQENQKNYMRFFAELPTTLRAIRGFTIAFNAIPGNPAAVLQAAYINGNPDPAGQRRLPDAAAASGAERYEQEHKVIHPLVSDLLEIFNYRDMYLIDVDGNVIYSVRKDADFATNLKTGNDARTGLGQVYRAAMAGQPGDIHFADFVEYAPAGNAPSAFLATPVVGNSGQVIGAIAVRLPADSLMLIAEETAGLGKSGQAYIVGEDMRSRTASTIEGGFSMMAPMGTTPAIIDALKGMDTFNPEATLIDSSRGISATATVDVLGTKWALVLERQTSEILASVDTLAVETMVALLIASVVIAGLGVLIARTITKPINRISAAIQTVASGDLSVAVLDVDRNDEVGEIARSLDHLRGKLTAAEAMDLEIKDQQADQRHVVEQLAAGLEDLTNGDLSRRLSESFSEEYEPLRLAFNTTIIRLDETVAQVVDTSNSMRARSSEISSAAEDLSHRTENQAAALEETAAALDELNASVKSTSEGAEKAESIAHKASTEAEESSTVVQGAISVMAEIKESSERISQIIGVIDDIAFQTNLLALNAGVEAARAGDAGRGFAVVASEIRALAQRASDAAKEIGALIITSTQNVERGVDQVGLAGGALDNIVERSGNIAKLVAEIAAAAGEQSTGLAEINIGVSQLDQVTQKNAAMVEESTAASQALQGEALALAELVSHFETSAGNQNGADKIADLSLHRAQQADRAAVQPVAVKAQRQEAQMATSGGKGIWQEF